MIYVASGTRVKVAGALSARPARPPLVSYVSPSVCIIFYLDMGMLAPEASAAQSIQSPLKGGSSPPMGQQTGEGWDLRP